MRATKGAARNQAKKRLFQAVEGFVGGRRRLLRTAKETLLRAGMFAFRDRRAKKREFRKLFITRLSAAAEMRGLRYSRLIHGLQPGQDRPRPQEPLRAGDPRPRDLRRDRRPGPRGARPARRRGPRAGRRPGPPEPGPDRNQSADELRSRTPWQRPEPPSFPAFPGGQVGPGRLPSIRRPPRLRLPIVVAESSSIWNRTVRCVEMGPSGLGSAAGDRSRCSENRRGPSQSVEHGVAMGSDEGVVDPGGAEPGEGRSPSGRHPARRADSTDEAPPWRAKRAESS